MPEIDLSPPVYAALLQLPDHGRAIEARLTEAWEAGCRLRDKGQALAALAAGWADCQEAIIKARLTATETQAHFISLKNYYKARIERGEWPGHPGACGL